MPFPAAAADTAPEIQGDSPVLYIFSGRVEPIYPGKFQHHIDAARIAEQYPVIR